MAHEDKDLEFFWAQLRPRKPVEESPPELPISTADMDPGSVLFSLADGRCRVLIKPNGEIEYGQGYTPELGARLFWEAVAQHRPPPAVTPDEAASELLFRTMETMLLRVGRADLHNERMHLRARRPEATEHDQLMAQVSHDNLETLVHQLIEYARGLALRPTLPSSYPHRYVGQGLDSASEAALARSCLRLSR